MTMPNSEKPQNIINEIMTDTGPVVNNEEKSSPKGIDSKNLRQVSEDILASESYLSQVSPGLQTAIGSVVRKILTQGPEDSESLKAAVEVKARGESDQVAVNKLMKALFSNAADVYEAPEVAGMFEGAREKMDMQEKANHKEPIKEEKPLATPSALHYEDGDFNFSYDEGSAKMPYQEKVTETKDGRYKPSKKYRAFKRELNEQALNSSIQQKQRTREDEIREEEKVALRKRQQEKERNAPRVIYDGSVAQSPDLYAYGSQNDPEFLRRQTDLKSKIQKELQGKSTAEKPDTVPVVEKEPEKTKPRVAYDPRANFQELDALKYNTSFQQQQADLEKNIKKELISKTEASVPGEPKKEVAEQADFSSLTNPDRVLDYIAQWTADNPDHTDADFETALTTMVSGFTDNQRTMLESYIRKGPWNDGNLDEKFTNNRMWLNSELVAGLKDGYEGIETESHVSPLESVDALSENESIEREQPEWAAAGPGNLDFGGVGSTIPVVEQTAQPTQDTSPIKTPEVSIGQTQTTEPRVFRKADGSEVVENTNLETEAGQINVSPVGGNSRYAIGEDKLERVSRVFKDAEGKIYKETDLEGVVFGSVNVIDESGRKYARSLNGLTRVDNQPEPIAQPAAQSSIDSSPVSSPDANKEAPVNAVEINKMVKTSDTEPVKAALDAGEVPILNYKGKEFKVLGMSDENIRVMYAGQNTVIGLNDELQGLLKDGTISFTVSEKYNKTPQERAEKANENFKQKYTKDLEKQGFFSRLANKVWFGRGDGDQLEKSAMSEETTEAYENMQQAVRARGQEKKELFLEKMKDKTDWTEERKQEVAERLQDRYVGVKSIFDRQEMVRELRDTTLEEKNPVYRFGRNLRRKWDAFEKGNPKSAAITRFGLAGSAFAASAAFFGVLNPIAIGGGFISRQFMKSKYASINGANLHTERMMRMPFDQAKKLGNSEKAEAAQEEMTERSRIEVLRKQFEAGQIDAIELQRQIEKIQRGDVRRRRTRWLLSVGGAMTAGGVSSDVTPGANINLSKALDFTPGIAYVQDWFSQLFADAPISTGPGPDVIPTESVLETPAQRSAPVVEAMPVEPIVKTEATTPDPLVATSTTTTAPPTTTIETQTTTPAPSTTINSIDPTTPPPMANIEQVEIPVVEEVAEVAPLNYEPKTIDAEMRGPKIGGFKGEGTYTQNVPELNTNPDGSDGNFYDPAIEAQYANQRPVDNIPNMGGAINNSGNPIYNPNVRNGPSMTVGVNTGGIQGQVTVGQPQNIPTGFEQTGATVDGPQDIFKRNPGIARVAGVMSQFLNN